MKSQNEHAICLEIKCRIPHYIEWFLMPKSLDPEIPDPDASSYLRETFQ